MLDREWGDCSACREYGLLKRWRLTVFGEQRYAWICRLCRADWDSQEIATIIEFNHTRKGVAAAELMMTRNRNPSAEELAEVRAVAEIARDILALLGEQSNE